MRHISEKRVEEIDSSVLNGRATLFEPLRIHFVTMGCAKNEVDSNEMAKALSCADAVITDEAETADCIIVNTCSFIQAATEESIEAIFDACSLPRVQADNAKVIVAGCMPSRYGADLENSLEEVTTFVPCSKEDDICLVVENLFPGRLSKVDAQAIEAPASVYVKISDGCDRFCSFCTIPFIRGRYRSFSVENIFFHVEEAVGAGAREIVLIAQDTGRYGQDFDEPISLAQLLDKLASAYVSTWFRVMYLQPEGVTDELLSVMGAHENIASYLDIPFQHSNMEIIKKMNRRGTGEEYLELIRTIRSVIPDITLRTTLIVGFPGETEEMFEELCAFVEEAEFDYVGVFAYSQEEGTKAAKLPDQIDEAEKQYRLRTVRDIADAISSVRIAMRCGSEMDVLVLGKEDDGQLFGRAMCQAPDVDGVVYLSHGEVGSFIRVTISDTLMYEMEAE